MFVRVKSFNPKTRELVSTKNKSYLLTEYFYPNDIQERDVLKLTTKDDPVFDDCKYIAERYNDSEIFTISHWHRRPVDDLPYSNWGLFYAGGSIGMHIEVFDFGQMMIDLCKEFDVMVSNESIEINEKGRKFKTS
jgi:hypothetical protein